jgi:hypothetical protein
MSQLKTWSAPKLNVYGSVEQLTAAGPVNQPKHAGLGDNLAQTIS